LHWRSRACGCLGRCLRLSSAVFRRDRDVVGLIPPIDHGRRSVIVASRPRPSGRRPRGAVASPPLPRVLRRGRAEAAPGGLVLPSVVPPLQSVSASSSALMVGAGGASVWVCAAAAVRGAGGPGAGARRGRRRPHRGGIGLRSCRPLVPAVVVLPAPAAFCLQRLEGLRRRCLATCAALASSACPCISWTAPCELAPRLSWAQGAQHPLTRHGNGHPENPLTTRAKMATDIYIYIYIYIVHIYGRERRGCQWKSNRNYTSQSRLQNKSATNCRRVASDRLDMAALPSQVIRVRGESGG